ncbi:MAG: hypothetical protein HQM04_06980 [Magnetococcales bacterium]|nr:hypothetical protein [Magnetococcales bacterium]MBF0114772.1 hypothetical protein [Magnetococcales bacterium]
MSAEAIFLDPFLEIIDFSFLDWQWSLQVERDDGLHYSPLCGQGLTLRLYDATSQQWLFSGSTASLGGQPLSYAEAVPGLVDRFVYQEGLYAVTLAADILAQWRGESLQGFACLLETEGENSLKCLYPRRYLPDENGTALPPGHWQVTIPYWSVRQDTRFSDLLTTDQRTWVKSSIPYQIRWQIVQGNSYAWFRLPWLVVVWSPDATLQGWEGLMLLSQSAPQGELFIPRQTVPGLNPPDHLPQQSSDRIVAVYQDRPVIMALGATPGHWSASQIDCSSTFAASFTIPFANALAPPMAQEEICPEPPTPAQEKLYLCRYRYVWQGDFFYETGEGAPLYTQQQAQLLQSPYTGMQRLLVEPLPEGVE